MAFTITSCPYCDGAITPGEGGYYICQSCGRNIVRSRASNRAFISGHPLENDFTKVFSLMEDDILDRSLALVEGMIEGSEEIDRDLFFLRGLVYSRMGEDGKAAMDWKKGIELMTEFDDIDVYVCMMCKCVADMILSKEREFVSFDPVKYIDGLSNYIFIHTGISCRGIMFSTILRDYDAQLKDEEVPGSDSLVADIYPLLLRRTVEYSRSFRTAASTIDLVLDRIGFDEETYEDDDNYEFYVYHLMRQYITAYTADMSQHQKELIFNHWNDKNMPVLQESFDKIIGTVRSSKSLSDLFKIMSPSDEAKEDSMPMMVDEHVRKYLLLEQRVTVAEDAPADQE